MCPACARFVRAGFGRMVVCRACGGYGSPITVPRRFQRLSVFLEDVVKFPVRSDGWLIIVVFALLLTGLKMVWILGTGVAAIWLGTYLFLTASRSADGQDELPPVADFSRAREALTSLWSALSAFAFASTPACWYILRRAHKLPWELFDAPVRAIAAAPAPTLTFWTTPLFKIDGFVFDALLLLLTVPIVLWMPAILLLAVTGTSLTDIVNPETSVRTYARMGRASLLLLATPLAVFGVDVFADAFIDFNWVRLDFVGNPLAEMVKLYAALIGARLFGLVLFVKGYAIDFGRPEDYLVPVLGELEPEETVEGSIREEDARVPSIELPASEGGAMVLTTTGELDAAHVIEGKKRRRERGAIDLPESKDGEEMQVEYLGADGKARAS